jgi:hypothetical protein
VEAQPQLQAQELIMPDAPDRLRPVR